LLLLALLLPPTGPIGLLVMHAVERLDDADSRSGRVSSSDLSWQSSAQAQAYRLRRPSADTHTTPANPHWSQDGLGCCGNRRSSR